MTSRLLQIIQTQGLELAHSICNAMLGIGTALKASLHIILKLKRAFDGGQMILIFFPSRL